VGDCFTHEDQQHQS